MEMAVEAADRHGARVKLELEAAAAPAADAIPPPPPPLRAEVAADSADGNERVIETDDVKTLKLRLFQELQRSRQRDAWRTYWRALQQYVIAKLSVDELQYTVETLLAPEADTRGNTAAKEMTKELSEKAAKPTASSAVEHHADRESAKKNGKRPLSSMSSPEVSDESDIDTSVKKLLHFANSNRTSASREDTDEQSAELLIGLGHFSSK
uniref:Uncharacterized protein n=1 Tax=Globisporangium ultimum (strain ATCC 200006 / CBS 805.95 / DAOM BR144) TaxID=431595 RepID=K3X892_GLOUD